MPADFRYTERALRVQTLSWYLRRLRAMSPDELAWRLRSAARGSTDRLRVALGFVPAAPAGPLYPPEQTTSRWCPVAPGEWVSVPPDDPVAAWRDRLTARADAIRAHRFSFFDLDEVQVGNPVDWNRDHAAGIAAPMTFAAGIDYRDHRVTGDAKVVWELNRHHHFVVLARAYRATGRTEYAAEVVAQLESWLDQNPYGYGMNWRSPLELGVRLVNWVWALDLIAGSSAIRPPVGARILHAIRLHVWDVARKYSRGSSANNHLVGEACGVFVAASYFRQLPDAERLRDYSQSILAREIHAQTYPSGASREQAFGYHVFVLQFFVYAGLVARWSGRDFDEAYWKRLEAMFDFAAAMCEGGPPPTFGDADDGYVLDLGNAPRDVEALGAVGAMLFGGRASSIPPERVETVRWLFSWPAAVARPSVSRAGALRSRSVGDAGYYLLQWGAPEDRDRVSVLFDCGELGFGALAAHGHADALSFTLRAFGVDVLVDPGTYDYFTYPEWRRYFRSTRAHNTVAVDDQDQSVMLGSFLWGRRAAARCTEWRPVAGGGRVAGEHDGYTRLTDPVRCLRRLTLDQASRTLVIDDEIEALGRHSLTVRFHLAEPCDARQEGNRIDIDFGAGRATLILDGRLRVGLVRAGDARSGGWVAPGYHRKLPSWTVAAHVETDGRLELRCVLELWPPAGRARPPQA